MIAYTAIYYYLASSRQYIQHARTMSDGRLNVRSAAPRLPNQSSFSLKLKRSSRQTDTAGTLAQETRRPRADRHAHDSHRRKDTATHGDTFRQTNPPGTLNQGGKVIADLIAGASAVKLPPKSGL